MVISISKLYYHCTPMEWFVHTLIIMKTEFLKNRGKLIPNCGIHKYICYDNLQMRYYSMETVVVGLSDSDGCWPKLNNIH